MQTRIVIAFALVALSAGAAGAAPGQVSAFHVPAETSPPFTYCIWYLPDPEKESFVEALRASPPDLFHLGYHIPFKAALGPTFGHALFTDDILGPEEIPREVARIQRVLEGMRAAKVRRIIPYVYTMAFFGHPEKRTGFFRFYDHWDDYHAFGLGPKPEADPALWLQVRGPNPLGGGPADVLHYEPCINHPAWAGYLDVVVRELARVGYDGMFFDVNTLYCYCPHCQEKFDVYLLRKYGREGLREHFGTADHRQLDLSTIYRDFEETILGAFKTHLAAIWDREKLAQRLGAAEAGGVALDEDWRLLRCHMQDTLGEFPPRENLAAHLRARFGEERIEAIRPASRPDFTQTVLRHYFGAFLEGPDLAGLLEQRFGSSDVRRRCCSEPRAMLLWVETQRFWCDSMAALFARLKRVGRAALAEAGRTTDFFTVANLGSMATVDGLNKRRVNGIDLTRWARTADMQMFEEMNQVGMFESGVILSNVFAFRWAMGAGTRAGTLLYKVGTDRAADLAHAEAAAGGGGALIQRGLDAPESRRRWKRFYAENAALWEAGESWARAGLLFWHDQVFYELPEHLIMARTLAAILCETQIPFDIITEENAEDWSRYDVIFAPMLRYLSDEQIRRLLEYARAGGKLVAVEPFGTDDPYARPRGADPLAAVAPGAGGFEPVAYGKGLVLRLAPADVPERRSDFWRLMEERGNAFVRAREFLDKARRSDVKDGVDFGPEFIQQLEAALRHPLRWCPEHTDPGVYFHAYRLPAHAEMPERLVVHVVNYHVPIVLVDDGGSETDPTWSPATRAGEPMAVRGLEIRLPLPVGLTVGEVRAVSPTDAIRPIKWSVHSGHVSLTLPELCLYQAIEIRCCR